jgi:glycerol kinase
VTVLAIDQGTSGTKVLVHDGERVLAVAEHPVRTRPVGPDGVEVDPWELLSSVLEAGRQALAAAGAPGLRMVCLANQGETVLAWDRATGEPLSRAMVWQDRRADVVCRELRESAALVAQRTGLVLDAYFCAPKMVWLRRNVTTNGVVTTSDAWLANRLAGVFVTDATTASRSLLTGLDTGAWDAEMIEVFGLGGELRPTIVDNDAVVGSTGAFGADVPLGGLIVDQQAALAAERCLHAGDVKCTYGTGAFLLANSGCAAVRSSRGLSTSTAWSLSGRRTYCLDAQAYTVGAAVDWLVRTGMLSSARRLDDETGPETGGVTFVPALAGMGAPWWTSGAAGALLGLSLGTDRGSVLRAVIEGLCCQIAVLIRETGSEIGTPISRLRADGGLIRSAVLMQAQADLLQVPVECYSSPHATALGALAMGRLASGDWRTLADAVPAPGSATTYEPRWSADRAAHTVAQWEAAVAGVLDGRVPR